MHNYEVTTMISKEDVLDEDDGIYDEALDYLINRSNTLSEIEYLLASSNYTQESFEKAIYDFNKDFKNYNGDKQKAMTLMVLMNMLEELRYFKSMEFDIDEEEED